MDAHSLGTPTVLAAESPLLPCVGAAPWDRALSVCPMLAAKPTHTNGFCVAPHRRANPVRAVPHAQPHPDCSAGAKRS
jgi:hypothetical protein